MNTGLYTTRKQVGIGAQLKLIKTSEDSQGGAENHKREKLQVKNTLKVKQEVTGWPRGEEKGTQEGKGTYRETHEEMAMKSKQGLHSK